MILTLEFVAISLVFSALVTVHMSFTLSFSICFGTPFVLKELRTFSFKQLAKYPYGSSTSQR